ncbi:hypothetical protein [Pseudomonas sp.]|uniref:hypothetical protein n=1 Tax=Pseudomonas sp. TaxID=306 RepID=UPI0031E3DD3E
MLVALRTTSFNNAAIADRLASIAPLIPTLKDELRTMASQLEQDADTLEVFVKEIHEGRIVRSP